MFLCSIETLHEIIMLISTTSMEHLPSMLSRCWLGGRKGIRPVKKLSGGVLAWLSVYKMWHIWGQCFYDADDHSRQNAFNEMSNAISNMLKMLKICYQFGQGAVPPGPSAEPPLWQTRPPLPRRSTVAHTERKCADTIGTVLVSGAAGVLPC